MQKNLILLVPVFSAFFIFGCAEKVNMRNRPAQDSTETSVLPTLPDRIILRSHLNSDQKIKVMVFKVDSELQWSAYLKGIVPRSNLPVSPTIKFNRAPKYTIHYPTNDDGCLVKTFEVNMDETGYLNFAITAESGQSSAEREACQTFFEQLEANGLKATLYDIPFQKGPGKINQALVDIIAASAN